MDSKATGANYTKNPEFQQLARELGEWVVSVSVQKVL